MREIEIKVWPIRIGEQAREIEVERRKGSDVRSLPHLQGDDRRKDLLERRGERERRKNKNI